MSRRTASESGAFAKNSGHGVVLNPVSRPVFAKRLFVEKRRRPQFRIKLPVVSFVKLLDVDPNLRDQLLRHRAVQDPDSRSTASRHNSAASAHRPKFISLRVPAKIVVIVENQNPCATSRRLAKKISRRQPADPAAYNDQIVRVVNLRYRPACIPFLPITQPVRVRIRAIVVPAHPRQAPADNTQPPSRDRRSPSPPNAPAARTRRHRPPRQRHPPQAASPQPKLRQPQPRRHSKNRAAKSDTSCPTLDRSFLRSSTDQLEGTTRTPSFYDRTPLTLNSPERKPS